MHNPKAHQRLAEASAKGERKATVDAIRAGLVDVAAGRTKPARSALTALAKKCGISKTDR